MMKEEKDNKLNRDPLTPFFSFALSSHAFPCLAVGTVKRRTEDEGRREKAKRRTDCER